MGKQWAWPWCPICSTHSDFRGHILFVLLENHHRDSSLIPGRGGRTVPRRRWLSRSRERFEGCRLRSCPPEATRYVLLLTQQITTAPPKHTIATPEHTLSHCLMVCPQLQNVGAVVCVAVGSARRRKLALSICQGTSASGIRVTPAQFSHDH